MCERTGGKVILRRRAGSLKDTCTYTGEGSRAGAWPTIATCCCAGILSPAFCCAREGGGCD
jgi:hypothetical protein